MAWAFSETSQYVTIANHAALNFPDADWAMGGFVYFDDNDGTLYQYVYNHGPSSGAALLFYLGEYSNSGFPNKLITTIRDADTSVSGSDTISDDPDTWHHFLLQRSSGSFYLYKDNSVVYSGPMTGVNAVAPSGDAYFGAREDLEANRFLGGRLAEWAKWDRALDSDERAALVKGYSPSFFMKDLKWYVPMVRDYTARVGGITITNNGTTVVQHPPILYPSRGV